VSVAVEVIVVVEEVVSPSAMASRGRRRAAASDETRILRCEKCVRVNEGSIDFHKRDQQQCDTINRDDRRMLAPRDRMFRYIPSAIEEMLEGSWSCVLFRGCRVLGLACATMGGAGLNERVKCVLKNVMSIACLRYTQIDGDGIDLSKTRIDFANEV
jgi:hypothetical protein